MDYTIESITKTPTIAMIHALLTKWNVKVDTILDLGCGYGDDTILLKLMFQDKLLVGLDIDAGCCDYTKNVEKLNKNVLRASAVELPFKNEQFDLVVCDQVIEHVDDQQVLVDEIYRVLRPGGYAFLGSVLKTKWYGVGFSLNKYHKIVLHPDHVREYGSKEEFAGLFDSRFNLLDISLIPITINLWGLPWRLARMGLIKFNPKIGRRKSGLMQKLQLANPGYYTIAMLGTKKQTFTGSIAHGYYDAIMR